MRPSDRLPDPLVRESISATLRRMGLLSNAQPFACAPLSGGVSSDIWRITVGERQYCLKRALPRLKVAQLWEAPVSRNRFEWEWFQTAGAICADCVPNLVAHDPEAGLFVMDYLDPKIFPVWKEQLRDGLVDEQTAEQVAERLASIHAATSNDEHVAGQFATDDAFYAIRL
jgi:5-methylthioribose kinase